MSAFRFVRCPVCRGNKFVILEVDGREEATGCEPCGGNWREFGTGVIGVAFELHPGATAALLATKPHKPLDSGDGT